MSRQKNAVGTNHGGAITTAAKLLLSTPNYTPSRLDSQAHPKSHFQPLIDQSAKFRAAAAHRGDCERVLLHLEVWHSLQCAKYGLPYEPLFGGER